MAPLLSVIVGVLGYALNSVMASHPEYAERIRATLSPMGHKLVDDTQNQCIGETAMRFRFKRLQDFFLGDVSKVVDNPIFHALFREQQIGNHKPEALMHFIAVLGSAIGREPQLVMKPMQPGDVQATYADITAISRDTGWAPHTGIETGLPQLVGWVRDYYGT